MGQNQNGKTSVTGIRDSTAHLEGDMHIHQVVRRNEVSVQLGQLFAMLSALCYALSYIFIRKGQTASAPPDGGLLPVLVISTVALDSVFVCAWLLDSDVSEWPTKSLLPLAYAALSGLIGTLVGRLALYRAIHALGATRGVVIKGLAPIVTVAVITLTTDEQVVTGDLVGLLCLVIAVLLLFFERKFTYRMMRSLSLFRNSIVIAGLAALAQGIGHAFRQMSVHGELPALLAASVDVTTALVFYLLSLSIVGKVGGYIRRYRLHMNSSLLLAGLSSALGVLLFFVAIQWVAVTTVSVLVATEPLIVAILSAIFFPQLERITWWSAFAAIIVAGGVIFIHVA